MPRGRKKIATVLEDVLLREPAYSLKVKVLGKLYSSIGETFDEAVKNLGIKNAKGMSVWRVTHNGKTIEKVIMPAQTFRIFGFQGMARDIAMKSFKTMFSL